MSKSMYMMHNRFVSEVEDEEFAGYAVQGFDDVLWSFMGANVERYKSRMTDKPKRMRAIIQNRTTDNPQFATLRQMLYAVDETVECGNYICWNNEWWIVPYLPGGNGVYNKAYLWYCNYMLKFVSPITGEVVCYPANTENATRYNSGERETERMTLGTSQHIVYIPNNDETILLNHGSRFIFDLNEERPTVMRISQVDSTSFAYGNAEAVRLLRLTLKEDQYNAVTDDKLLGVASYTEYNDPPLTIGSTMYG